MLDRIQVQANVNGTAINTFAQILDATGNVKGGTAIDLGGGHSVTLWGLLKSQLGAANFAFLGGGPFSLPDLPLEL